MKPPKGREAWLWDSEVHGFGVRARARVRTYVLRYPAPGRPGESSWLTIGTHGQPWRPDPATGHERVLTADLARAEAIRLLGATVDGIDPGQVRAASAAIPTLAVFARGPAPGWKPPEDDKPDERPMVYMFDHAATRKPKSARDDWRYLDHHILPAMGRERFDLIGPSHVTRLHNAMKATPFAANRCLALLSHIFTMGRRWGILPRGHVNPCTDVVRFPEPKRKRYLSAAERPRAGGALAAAEAKGQRPRKERKKGEGATVYAIAALRILMLTGARPDEIVRLRRDQLAELVNQKGKTGERAIYFDKHALAIIKALPVVPGNPYVFVGRRRGRHVTATAISQLWKRIARGIGLADVRLYDLRHTFASVARKRGQSWPNIGALLGHKRVETTQGYTHVDDESVRAASDEVGEEIAAALGIDRPRES